METEIIPVMTQQLRQRTVAMETVTKETVEQTLAPPVNDEPQAALRRSPRKSAKIRWVLASRYSTFNSYLFVQFICFIYRHELMYRYW